MEELCRLTKTIPGLQAAVSLMLLSKNLLFMTLGSQRNMYKSKSPYEIFKLAARFASWRIIPSQKKCVFNEKINSQGVLYGKD